MRSYRLLLIALGSTEVALLRDELIEQVWPAAEASVGRNRLRVALAKLRRELPGAIVETPQGLRLDRGLVSVDVDEIRQALDQVQDTVTPQAELSALRQALEPVRESKEAGFGPGLRSLLAKAFLRCAELEFDFGNFEAAGDSAFTAIELDLQLAGAWEIYLMARWRLGDASALGAFRDRAPASVKSNASVRDALSMVQTKSPDRATSSDREGRAFMAELIEVIKDKRPELMRMILSAPETLALSGKQPRMMHDFLAMATPLDLEVTDTTWERAASRMVGLRAWLGDAQGVLDGAAAVLAKTSDPACLRATWNSVAVAHSLLRQWEEAFHAIDQTIQYSRQIKSEMYELSARGNAAYFRMQQGRLDEADEEYSDLLENLARIETNQAQFESKIAIGNRALIPVFRGDWPRAHEQLEAAIKVRTAGGEGLQVGIPQGALALSKIQLGRPEQALKLMRLSFVDAFRSESIRTQQFTFEMAAVALFEMGERDFASALCTWVEAWRRDTQAPRSEAEASLVSSVQKHQVSERIGGTPVEMGRETLKRLRARLNRVTGPGSHA